MDAPSREICRQKFDREIQDAIDLVRRLKTRRNTLAPVSRLPTEILARIFATIAHSCLDGFGYPILSWICSVTAVCGHWRAIALGCPSLWCFINSNQPIWNEEMLKRSKAAPLIIKVDDLHFTLKRLDSVHLALQHISRTKELRIVASKGNIEVLINRIDDRAPLLRSLCLSNTRGDDPMNNNTRFQKRFSLVMTTAWSASNLSTVLFHGTRHCCIISFT
jgi:hypothetical protein